MDKLGGGARSVTTLDGAEADPIPHRHDEAADRRAYGPSLLLVLLFLALLLRNRLGLLANEDFRLWSTLFVSVVVQALPFLVLGVVIRWFHRSLRVA